MAESDPSATAGVVAIVGAGTMGAGIAQVALEGGASVRLFDVSSEALARGRERIWDGLLRRAAKAGGRAAADPARWAAATLDRLSLAASVEEVAGGPVQLVIEAALEDLEAKREVFRALDAVAGPEATLATNTSALSVARIAEATTGPERVIGLHFFNPAPLMRLVEVVGHRGSDRRRLERATATMRAWGKSPVRVSDSPGFIVNRVNRPFTLEALRLLRSGVAPIEEIDAAIEAEGFPMGPFRLMDLVGIDVNLAAARSLFEAFGRPSRFRPSPIQEALVASGRLGRKSGEGFYRYDDGRLVGPSRAIEELVHRASPLERDAPEADGDAETTEAEARDDPPAGIAERIVLAIANEAFRALDERIASEAEIDLAMRLGANHPYGPLEWARRTGLAEVALMLDVLADEDADTFRPALGLLRAATAAG